MAFSPFYTESSSSRSFLSLRSCSLLAFYFLAAILTTVFLLQSAQAEESDTVHGRALHETHQTTKEVAHDTHQATKSAAHNTHQATKNAVHETHQGTKKALHETHQATKEGVHSVTGFLKKL